ncbi:hypothetical protein ACWT_7224 [Actinoplanes sp. SE50]|uniref:LPXTG cell wall anchor domain-containing protein n=1 Tax=unclassified Actinoplanes TaxID=2626549 RepID=UPI00023EDED2|nr:MULTISPECIES: LPXTG cell wall anchor domain-containing protein [unclassified Actinoplanes]AEV88234.1 hypothetical protein ACPL_7354 [Actinoplanes sp. SE50/110]ATO86639.1 hypothetical protein ACWT_7224 [Actinoplanes sp. SE50]SLM04056.1 hypothetical protein ACSP50_7358 [Actinoplanes sp. SE50/110]
MHRPSARRLLAGLATATAVALTTATPAFAATPKINVTLDDVAIGAGYAIKVSPVLRADREVELTGAVMTYQLTGTPAGVTLANPDEFGDCASQTPTTLVCKQPFGISIGPYGVMGYLEGALKASRTTPIGSTGKLTATFAADGVAPIKSTANVVVAEGVDLVAGKPDKHKVKVGETFTGTVTVTNKSDKTVHGVGLSGYADYAYEPTAQFSNCSYHEIRMNCRFDQDLEPGATYALEFPFRVRTDTAAPSGGAAEYKWLPVGDYDAQTKALKTTAGTGGMLKLTKVAAATSRARQTDTNPDDNWSLIDVDVTGQQSTDIAAIGDKVSGAAGTVVNATVGVRNNGPATRDTNHAGDAASVLRVTIPAGAKVTTVPDGCAVATDWLQSDKKAVQYVCSTGYLFRVGETVSWTFGLKIDKVVPGASGAVEANPACECDIFSKDTDKSNDKALLVLNPAGGTGGTGGSDGPGLPITGPQGAAIAGAGGLLVAAGAVSFLIARRRRTRFQA